MTIGVDDPIDQHISLLEGGLSVVIRRTIESAGGIVRRDALSLPVLDTSERSQALFAQLGIDQYGRIAKYV